MAAALAVALGVAVSVVAYRSQTPASEAATLASLVRPWREHGRTIEPRLSGGFEWAPFHRSPAAQDAGTTLRGDDENDDARHLGGLALLLAGHPRKALSALKTAAGTSRDAGVWNDYAVALHE
ncbi:MAG TPA: hypothetical protein VF215_11685, partial [Thermoanaerobaculia bacterium]